MSRSMISAFLVGAVVATGAAGCTSGSGGDGGGWRQLPEAPLSPRTDAVVVGIGDSVLVVGGWEFLCPPNADCSTPSEPLLPDGAVYDRAGDSWRAAAPPPFGLRGPGRTAVLDDTAYVLTTCASGPDCDAPLRLLSYHLPDDRWTDHGQVPGPERGARLVALERTVLVAADASALGRVPDVVFDPGTATWSELPADPLPAVHDRYVVPAGDQLVVAGSAVLAPGSDELPRKVAARLDLASGTWTVLPDGPGLSYQLFATDDGPLLAGHFDDDSSALLDQESWTWTAAPDHGDGTAGVSGVLDRDRATYDVWLDLKAADPSRRSVVYDSVADAFVVVPALPDRADASGQSSTGLGRDLFVFGGERWSDATDSEGELLRGAWLWAAPTA
ncbi:hypothetical protein [Blastococcus sp. SYSU D01042]